MTIILNEIIPFGNAMRTFEGRKRRFLKAWDERIAQTDWCAVPDGNRYTYECKARTRTVRPPPARP